MSNIKETAKKIGEKVKIIDQKVKEVEGKILESDQLKEIKQKIMSSDVAEKIIQTITKDPHYKVKKQIFEKIKSYDTIIIHRHMRPDGDCMGSSFGLRDILQTSFPNKKILSVGEDKAEYLAFMGVEDGVKESDYENALVIVVDTGNEKRISGKYYRSGKELIKIDHHVAVEDYGDINYVREEMASTTTIIMDFFKTFDYELKMTQNGALALYIGTITDTGRFRYSAVNGNTLRLAGDMLDYGFDTEKMFAHLTIKEQATLKLHGYVLNHFKTTKNGVSYIYINKRIQNKFKVSLEEASSLVNTLDSIKGSLIWILFVETDDVIRVRLRSRYASVIEIAQKYQGGGHKQASGASVFNRKEMKELIKMADDLLKNFKNNNGDLF